MKKLTRGTGEERGKVPQGMKEASQVPLQPPVKLEVSHPQPQLADGRKSRMHPLLRGGVNVQGLSPPLRDVPSSPGGQRRPTSPDRKQEIPPRWGTEPEVPPLDG